MRSPGDQPFVQSLQGFHLEAEVGVLRVLVDGAVVDRHIPPMVIHGHANMCLTCENVCSGENLHEAGLPIASFAERADAGGMAEDETERGMTVRQFIEQLTEAASQFPRGLDEPVELAICDSKNKQFVDHVEVTWEWTVREDTGRIVPGSQHVLILGHWHPGESPGPFHRGVTADVDEELRKFSGE
jgi:hypothetical protein